MSKPQKSIFATRLIYYRKHLGLSQEKLAEHLDCHQSTVGEWELDRPRSSPSWRQLAILAKLFGVTTDYLVGLSDSTHGLWPDQCIVHEDNEAAARATGKAPGWVVLKVPRRLRIVDQEAGMELVRELRLGKLS